MSGARPPWTVTTPIYYVNGRPHLGHAYTTVAADVAARYRRARGFDVFFLTGTDEHGQKVYQAARAAGLSPQAHCDHMVRPFQALWERLEIRYDDFIRTTEPRHVRVVQAVLERLHEQGDIYEDTYEGWYSTAAERFWAEEELVDGRCPDTGQPVEWIAETNLFFRMSRYHERFRRWVEEHPDFIQPRTRRNEVLGLLRQPPRDLCITRPRERLPWGVPVPWDDRFVTYVWFDALINYISALGYASGDPEAEAAFARRWPVDVHLLGKDILTTHTLYWGTMLLALGLPPARRIHAHGWWTVSGFKMSKSVGNVIDPNLLVDAYGADAVRYFLVREIRFGADGDFSHEAFLARYNAELANDLGNLAHRALSMTRRWLDGKVPAARAWGPDEDVLARQAAEAAAGWAAELDELHFKEALEHLVGLAGAGNKYLDTQAPWALRREGRTDRLATVLRATLEVCRVAALLLDPFCPAAAAELLDRLGAARPDIAGEGLAAAARLDLLETGAALRVGTPLFPRMQELPPAVAAVLEAARREEAGAGDPPAPTPSPEDEVDERDLVDIDTFSRVHLRAGRVVGAERHPNADRLLVLRVDVGEPEPRTIVAGVAARFQPQELLGRRVVVVTNLAPARLRGVVSEGMILATSRGREVVDLVDPGEGAEPGARVS